MIRNLGYIVITSMIVFSQPIGVLSDTINSDFQSSELEKINHDTAIEAQIEENNSQDSFNLGYRFSINTEMASETPTENSIDKDIDTETAYEDSSSVTEVEESNSTTDSIQESHFSESIDETEGDNEQKAVELVSGTWGTVPWTWDEETRTIELENGVAGTVSTSPWRTYTNVVRIIVRGHVVFPSNSSFMFSSNSLAGRLINLEIVENAENIDVSGVTSMSSMFIGASALTTVNVSNWDTSNVTQMNNMFSDARSLTALDVSNWNTSKVTSMFSMFRGARSLTALDVSKWDTSKVSNMNSMFSGASSLTVLDVSKWDTSSVTMMQSLFSNVAGLSEIDVSNWDVSKVTIMDGMFFNNMTGDQVSKFTTIDVSNWNTSKVQNMSSMFAGARNLVSLDVSNWNTSNVRDMSDMFAVTSRIEELDLSNWDTTNVGTDNPWSVTGMFRGMNRLQTLHLGRDTTFLHLPENRRPSLPENVMPLESFTGNWLYEKDSEGNAPLEDLTLTPTNFFHEYDGSKSGTYVWERREAWPVTVRYLDLEDNELIDSVMLNGKVGLPYESEAKEIPGWYVVETPGNADGIFTEEAQEVVYVYDRSDAAPVTVRYEDTAGNQLSEPTILSGKVGLPYESEAKEIPGWYVLETPGNADGIFTEEAQEVVYVYERSNAAPVTVRYQDTEGIQLSEPTILSGKAGLPYESEAKEIPGWYVVETPENATGFFSEEPQEVVYVFEREMIREETEPEETEVDLPHAGQGKEELPLLGAKGGFSLLGIGLIGLAWPINKLKFKKKSD